MFGLALPVGTWTSMGPGADGVALAIREPMVTAAAAAPAAAAPPVNRNLRRRMFGDMEISFLEPIPVSRRPRVPSADGTVGGNRVMRRRMTSRFDVGELIRHGAGRGHVYQLPGAGGASAG
jgi:hypothetical protein